MAFGATWPSIKPTTYQSKGGHSATRPLSRLSSLSLTSPHLQVSANIALEAFLIRPSNFLGLSCTALQRPLHPSAALPLVSGLHADEEQSAESDAAGAVESLLNFKCHTVNSSGGLPASQLSKVG